MKKTVLALGGAVAALAVTHTYAQQGFGEGGDCRKAPPGSGEQLCIDQRAWYDQQAPADTTFSQAPVDAQTPPLDTPPATDLAATDTAINEAVQPQRWAEAEPAPTPEASNVSATSASSMAYANIANGPNGVYMAKVGDYPMSAYASPPRPLPYDQVDAYLQATRSQQLAQNWWAGQDQLAEAETAPAGEVSATVDGAAYSHADIPNDTAAPALTSDTAIPQDDQAWSEVPVTQDIPAQAVDSPTIDDGTSDGPDYYY